MGYGGKDYGYSEAGYGYGVSAFTGFDGLSIVPDTLGWWSVARRVLSRYNGPAIRLRRSSDSAERDFYGIGPQGEVSTADVRAWNGWNLLARSNEFHESAWFRGTGISVEANAVTGPSGTLTASRINGFDSAAGDRVVNTITFSGAKTFTGTIWIKGEGVNIGKQVTLQLKRQSGTGVFATSVLTLTGDWVRHSVTITTLSDTVNVSFVLLNPGATSASSVLVTEAQLEVGSSFSTYEPRTTTGAGDSFLVTLYEQAENGKNLLARTEEFDVSPWANSISGTGVAPTVTANAGTSPIGDSTADRIQFSLGGGTASGDLSRRVQSTLSGAGTFVYSVYLRSFDGVSTYNMHLVDPNSQTRNIVVTGSWQRFEVSATTAVNATIGFGLRGAQSPAHPNTADVLVWGAQLEVGTTATTYERRTTHGAGTRLNFTQSTTTLQPIVCEQGVVVTENNRLAAKFVAADARRMSIASSTAMFNALHTTGGTVLAVSRANDTAATKLLLSNNLANNLAGFRFRRLSTEQIGQLVGRLDVAGVATAGNSVSQTTTDAASTSQAIVTWLVDPDNVTAASRSAIYQNGTLASGANAQTGTPFIENAGGDLVLGAGTTVGGEPWDGPISELALFSAAISTADRTAWQSRSGTFYGVTIS